MVKAGPRVDGEVEGRGSGHDLGGVGGLRLRGGGPGRERRQQQHGGQRKGERLSHRGSP
ncbi:MAG: hypothetical protein M5R40_13870 [Anaerolineae bacterium]|nr:hypothetical protein [Anaerolineae bacterium]